MEFKFLYSADKVTFNVMNEFCVIKYMCSHTQNSLVNNT